ncbi:MAG: Cohesin domain protein [Candidatus Argoarchaeum ethanivorans]|uniref:Cohesin domain protein n=1 Tax=Candidatus Argoarchaeum ethanivorans TaxID=2608793 RepID=A0A811T4A9_9EURY|nr:MAG: Cohesin domain protein [Candidatus Argoarchaeum ethanivorans]
MDGDELGDTLLPYNSSGGIQNGGDYLPLVSGGVASPILTTIAVTPSTATLNVGTTQVFTATAKDQYGNTMSGIVFTWTSSNGTVGTIDTNGLFTATITLGTTTIKAANGTVNGTATVTVTEETPTVSIGSADVSNGADVTVPINITGASNIGAMDISITYDTSVLNATGVENGTFNITIMAYNIDHTAGRINISFAEYPSTLNGSGELFNLRFAAIGVGNSTLDITVKEAWTGDVPPQPVAIVTVDGYVNVTGEARIPGDANGDTNVNIQDAVLLFNWVSFPGDQGTKYVLQ